MPVALDWKRLEAPLIQMAGAAGFVMRVPAHRMRDRQPSKELAHLIVVRRPHHEMPMIGHRDHGINRQRHQLPRLVEDVHKRPIIIRLLEDRHPCHGSIEYVKDFPRRTDAFGSWHVDMLTPTFLKINKNKET